VGELDELAIGSGCKVSAQRFAFSRLLPIFPGCVIQRSSRAIRPAAPEMTINPMQRADDAPRCKAKSKRTGKRCGAPAVRYCMHGPRGGAPAGKRNGNKSARHAHSWSDPSSEISQLVVTSGLGTL